MWQDFIDNKLPIITDNLPQLASGVWTTAWMVLVSLAVGILLAVPCGLVMARRRKSWLQYFVRFYSYVFRGSPMLIQLYIFYYGIGSVAGDIAWIRNTDWLWSIFRQAWPWTLIAFALNTGAYTAEIIRGAIVTTPRGEVEAATAMGMTPRQVNMRIVFPNAVRRALPAYGNEVIFMLHGSAIASVVTIMDITGVARNLYSRYYEPFTPFITAGLLYLCITFVIVGVFKLFEKHLMRHQVV